MITAIAIIRGDETSTISNPQTLARLNDILLRVANAYPDDPGTSDLDDEQSVYAVNGLTLGDVRLARRLVR
jgi:hypothetical protein